MPKKFKCIQPSWDELHSIAEKVADKIKSSGFQPDMIVGIARGGWFHARVLCDFLGVKDLLSLKVAHWGITATPDKKAKLMYPFEFDLSGRKVLLVDDITDTGDSFIVARKHLEKLKADEIRSAALYYIIGSKFKPDYYGEEIEWVWVIFPWNFTEDIINISMMTLEEEPLTTPELVKKLKENHNVKITHEKLEKILKEGIRRGELTFRNGRWYLARESSS